MALDPEAVKTPHTPEWWMTTLAAEMLSASRLQRFGILQAWADNQPPVVTVHAAQQRAWQSYLRMARVNLAGAVVKSRVNRLQIRSIRTAAPDDDDGDLVVARYLASSLRTAFRAAVVDQCTLSEGYIRVVVRPDGQPVAIRRDPRTCVVAPDPLDPTRAVAAMELTWDEHAKHVYAFLWLNGRQWVAECPQDNPPARFIPVGVSPLLESLPSTTYPRMFFSTQQFTMRPERPGDAALDDGRPYTESYALDRPALIRLPGRDGKGEFESVIPSLQRVNQKILQTLTVAAVQAWKQRALKQDDSGSGMADDRLPTTNPETGERIDWDAVFEPGPDALWKLPPGVSIWESGQVDMTPFHASETNAIKQVAMETGTPVPLLSDDVNQSAEGAQLRREELVFALEDLQTIDGSSLAEVTSVMLAMAPDTDQFVVAEDGTRTDRSDVSQIVVDWAPAERFSLAEKAAADSANKSLSRSMAGRKIWGLTAEEVAINKQELASDGLLLAQEAARVQSAG